jgi:hypothetical protein
MIKSVNMILGTYTRLFAIISCVLAILHSARASGDHGHDHDHGSVSCRDLAADKGWTIDCNDVTEVNTAFTYLTDNAVACKTAASFEWAGIFDVSGANSQTWTMAKKDGSYADPTMKVVLFSTTSVSEATMHNLEANVKALIEGTCDEIDDGETMTGISETGKCFEWHVDTSKEVSSFIIDTTTISGLAAYTAHSPYEFEADAHYLKDSSGADVEHVAEETSPGPSDDCKHNYWLMQMHHDHCPHDALDSTIETGLHDFEEFYTDCTIDRLYDPSKDDCPSVSCSSVNVDLADAVTTLTNSNCNTDCSSTTCKDTFQRILIAHDTCAESQLPTDLETGLHSFEDACEEHICNAVSAPSSSSSKVFSWKLISAVAGSAFFLLL